MSGGNVKADELYIDMAAVPEHADLTEGPAGAEGTLSDEEDGDEQPDEQQRADEPHEAQQPPSADPDAPIEVPLTPPARNDADVTFVEQADSVYCVACNGAFEDVVVSGGGDDTALLWSLHDGLLAHRLSGHTDSVVAAGFNYTGQYVATGALDNTVKVWDCTSGALLQTLDGPDDAIQWLDWHPRGNVLIAGADDGTVWMWMAVTGAFMQMFAGHTAPVTAGRFTLDGKTICTTSEDGTMRIWDPKTGSSKHVVQGHQFHSDCITCVSLHPSRDWVATGAVDSLACVSHVKTGKPLQKLQGHTESVECVEWIASGCSVTFCTSWLATASLDGDIRVWDVETGACVRWLRGHTDGVIRLGALSHDGLPFLISCATDATSCLWDVGTSPGKLKQAALPQKTEKIESAKNVASTANAIAPVQVLLGHAAPILAGSLSSNRQFWVTGGDDRLCLSFDVEKLFEKHHEKQQNENEAEASTSNKTNDG